MKQAPLPQNEIFNYFLATTILLAIGAIPYSPTQWDIYAGIAIAIIEVLGVIYLYSCNGKENGKDFLQRYFALGWVTGIRWLVMVMLPMFFLALVTGFAYVTAIPGTEQDYKWIFPLFTTVSIIIYFWMLGKHMKEVAQPENKPEHYEEQQPTDEQILE